MSRKQTVQERLQIILTKGGGIAYGDPYSLDHEDRVIDKHGRRLETVLEYRFRLLAEAKWRIKLINSTAITDITDPTSGACLVSKGKQIQYDHLFQFNACGLCSELLYKRATVQGRQEFPSI